MGFESDVFISDLSENWSGLLFWFLPIRQSYEKSFLPLCSGWKWLSSYLLWL